jgi:hypothetical protein
MIIVQEKKLSEGVDLQSIQKDILTRIGNTAIKYTSLKAQRSSPQKVFVGVALGALRGVAEWLNPLEGHCPAGGNPQVQKDAVDVYKKNILTAIADLEKIYTKDYNDSKSKAQEAIQVFNSLILPELKKKFGNLQVKVFENSRIITFQVIGNGFDVGDDWAEARWSSVFDDSSAYIKEHGSDLLFCRNL